MSVTVGQIMELEIMEKARVAAGKSGLSRVIRRVSFIDAPFTAEVLDEQGILMSGDFFISSFFVVKDNPGQMLEIMRLLAASDSSGLCIISKLFSELPPAIIDFANDHDYPVIFINQDAPYGDMIRDILILILRDREDTLIELELSNILGVNQNEENVKKVMLGINSHFAKHVVAVYCKCFDVENATKFVFLKNTINAVKEWTCVKFRDNILIILTFAEPDEENIAAKLKYVIGQLKLVSTRFVAGLGTLHKDLGHTNRAIMEAMTASELKAGCDQDVVSYKDLGSYKFLLPLKDKPELLEFHDEIILPIVEYDNKYKQDLLKTAMCFIDNDGDFSKTSKKMFLHENSIRYRINKIMEILNLRNKDLMFCEQLSIAVKLHRILTTTENGNDRRR